MTARVLARLGTPLAIVATALMTAGCVANRFGPVQEARSALIGFSDTDIRMCAGFPTKAHRQGDVEIWSYEKATPSATGVSLPVLPTMIGASMSMSGGGDCRMQVLFEGQKVVRIAYAGANDAISGRNQLCAPLVAECVRFAHEKAQASAAQPASRPGMPASSGSRTRPGARPSSS
ncbi:hypothetical protein ACUN0C_08255 [Faunimonas sp. B44]|uniref:hypothetical protein n=1 Tax=Faunimonas sp. B44 TaxID=3461493 RepID=UPI0040444391